MGRWDGGERWRGGGCSSAAVVSTPARTGLNAWVGGLKWLYSIACIGAGLVVVVLASLAASFLFSSCSK